jgi:DNA-binding FadR family transcriptional regulator
MEMNTKGLKSITLVDQVEQKILEYIRNNKLVPGDSIPNENELATSLEVGRSVVREALSRLRMLEMIESRTRRGMVLREPGLMNSLNKIVNPYLLSEEAILDLLGLRIALETGITDIIFNNITKEDIKELEDIIKVQKVLVGNKLTIKSELAFHTKLYLICRNEVIQNVLTIILPLFSFLNEHFDEFIPFNEKFSKTRKLVRHEDLLVYLKNGDRDGYRVAIVMHL